MKKIFVWLLILMLMMPNVTLAENIDVAEDFVTRAEMAKIIVRLLGWQLTSTGSVFPPRDTNFTDVSPEHWASGYIFQVNRSGIVRGDMIKYTRDTPISFRPDDAITYQEAVTMLVRAASQEAMNYLWDWRDARPIYPYGYIEVAGILGIIRDIDFTAGEYATRALLRQLVNNTLDAPFVIHNSHGRGGPAYFIFDGVDAHLMTIRTEAWDNQPVCFDGWEFVILDE